MVAWSRGFVCRVGWNIFSLLLGERRQNSPPSRGERGNGGYLVSVSAMQQVAVAECLRTMPKAVLWRLRVLVKRGQRLLHVTFKKQNRALFLLLPHQPHRITSPNKTRTVLWVVYNCSTTMTHRQRSVYLTVVHVSGVRGVRRLAHLRVLHHLLQPCSAAAEEVGIPAPPRRPVLASHHHDTGYHSAGQHINTFRDKANDNQPTGGSDNGEARYVAVRTCHVRNNSGKRKRAIYRRKQT